MPNEVDFRVAPATGTPTLDALAGFYDIGRSPTLESTFRDEFQTLATEWKRDAAGKSRLDQIVSHPAYMAILTMGRRALPLILEDLQQEPHHWFPALRAIVGDSPIRPEHAGHVASMTEAWLSWGRLKGYLGDGGPRIYFTPNISSTDEFYSSQRTYSLI